MEKSRALRRGGRGAKTVIRTEILLQIVHNDAAFRARRPVRNDPDPGVPFPLKWDSFMLITIGLRGKIRPERGSKQGSTGDIHATRQRVP